MNLLEKTIEKTTLFKGKILELINKKVLLPNNKIAIRDVIHTKPAVCIAVLMPNGNFIFEKQYRCALDKIVLEFPAGKIEHSDKSPLDAAIRELKEETGIIAKDFKFLGEFYPSPGICDEIIYLYSCVFSEMNHTNLDEDEFIDIIEMPLSEAVKMVLNNEIQDGKTQTLILKLSKM